MDDIVSKISLIPNANIFFGSGDPEVLTFNDGSTLLGISHEGFINFAENKDSGSPSIDVKYEYGCDSNIETVYKNKNDYKNTQIKNSNNLLFSRLTYTKNFNIDKIPFSFIFGYNDGKAISRDNCAGLKYGWFTYDPRNYEGFGLELIANPFIFNYYNTGMNLDLKLCKPLLLFCNYTTDCKYISKVPRNNIGRGFLNKETPNINNIGLKYTPNDFFNFVSIVQLFDRGHKKNNLIVEDEPGINPLTECRTSSCEKVISRFCSTRSTKIGSLTNIFRILISNNVELGGNLSFTSKIDTNSKNNLDSRLIRWNIGFVIKMLYFLKQFGIYVGSPTFLLNDIQESKDYSEDKKVFKSLIKKDMVPLFFEFNIIFEFLGFNVPLFFHFIKDKQKFTPIDYNNETDNAYVIGSRPYKIFYKTTEFKIKK